MASSTPPKQRAAEEFLKAAEEYMRVALGHQHPTTDDESLVQDTTHELPDEILTLIFKQADNHTLVTILPLVCKRWKAILYKIKGAVFHVSDRAWRRGRPAPTSRAYKGILLRFESIGIMGHVSRYTDAHNLLNFFTAYFPTMSAITFELLGEYDVMWLERLCNGFSKTLPMVTHVITIQKTENKLSEDARRGIEKCFPNIKKLSNHIYDDDNDNTFRPFRRRQAPLSYLTVMNNQMFNMGSGSTEYSEVSF